MKTVYHLRYQLGNAAAGSLSKVTRILWLPKTPYLSEKKVSW